jgi:hypothetical protein
MEACHTDLTSNLYSTYSQTLFHVQSLVVLSLFGTYTLSNIIHMEYLFNVNVLLSSTITELLLLPPPLLLLLLLLPPILLLLLLLLKMMITTTLHHARTQHIRSAVLQVRAAHREFERNFIHFRRYPINHHVQIIDERCSDSEEVH